ncbi:uncharacterized protein MELLADRAFT_67061 [Melampsora larici-populina 98AG31]|uniref:Uncharacterized protein n=1 Tax=Melampsora larici-populina (strain 98AG31 / pathotype 3-4-7) TaxID=747676 RepID=F4S1M6_MELLP|nr:uncharacterized protein MELLADRAFT_67061 [Melampsora larici-populina 98AG31]EGG01403.1 hypothetical protein MELLADRAFT_67061 [Melampsora larici-populina 98AG31]
MKEQMCVLDVEEPNTPPSMLRQARRFSNPSSNNETMDTIDVPLHLLIKILATRFFLEAKKTTYAPLNDQGTLMPSVEWTIMAQLWRLARNKWFEATFPVGFDITNRKLSLELFTKVKRLTPTIRTKFRRLVLLNIAFPNAKNPAIPCLQVLLLKIKNHPFGRYYSMKEDDINRIALIRLIGTDLINYGHLWIQRSSGSRPTFRIEIKSGKYHEAIREIDRRLFDNVRSIAQVDKEDMALLQIFRAWEPVPICTDSPSVINTGYVSFKKGNSKWALSLNFGVKVNDNNAYNGSIIILRTDL